MKAEKGGDVRMVGTVASVHRKKGFAFAIVREGDAEMEYFLHATGFEPEESFDDVEQGDAVEFSPVKSSKGWRGIAAKVLGRKG